MPDLFRDWQQPLTLDVQEIKRAYERGMAGAKYSEEEKERFRAEVAIASAMDVCHTFGFADQFAGKLVIPFVFVQRCYPNAWPGAAQQVGDCVSHNQKNANLTSLCCEVVAGEPDEVTGKREEAPKVSAAAEKQGVLSTEALYWFRGSAGHGWYCAASARISTTKAGCVLRQNYDFADLETYSGQKASKWGRSAPPADVIDKIDNNLLRTATEATTFEEIRDLLGRGFGVSSCGSEGFSDSRDENGVSKRSGRWAHAMAYIGADDRPEIHRKYGGPLVLVLNSWGPRWNSGPRRILGTEIDIPEGSFWARWSDVSRRDVYVMSGVNGWERRELPDYLGGWT